MKKSELKRPLAIDLPLPLLQRLTVVARQTHHASLSTLIRTALDAFDVEAFEPSHPPRLQISVRLPETQRRQLRRVAKATGVSIGELVRSAVEKHLARLPDLAPMPVVRPPAVPVPPPPSAPRPAAKPPVRARRR